MSLVTKSEMVMLNFLNHNRELCLRPYIAFLRRQTLFSPEQNNLEVAPYIPSPEDPHIRRHSLHPAETKAIIS